MAAGSVSGLKIWLLVIACLIGISSAQLYNNNFYKKQCPGVLRTVKKVVEDAVSKERRMAGSLLRLHFHDCFVQASDLISRLSSVSFMSKSWSPKVNIFHPTFGLNTSTSADQVLLIKETRGCDASVLLDDTPTFTGEKSSFPNANSLRGFEVIDKIKSELERTCPGVVSCADILAVAARDAIAAIGGPRWNVPLGRRDSTTASLDESNSDLPAPFLDRDGLVSAFAKKNFSQEEMVTLSGAHTIGLVRCTFFRDRIYNETNIDPAFAASMQKACPFEGGDDKLSPFDITTPLVFDNVFYQNLMKQKGLVHSDQELFVDGSGPTDSQVQTYSRNPRRFKKDFADAMFKMTLLSPLTGYDGEIRTNCRVINAPDSTTNP